LTAFSLLLPLDGLSFFSSFVFLAFALAIRRSWIYSRSLTFFPFTLSLVLLVLTSLTRSSDFNFSHSHRTREFKVHHKLAMTSSRSLRTLSLAVLALFCQSLFVAAAVTPGESSVEFDCEMAVLR
jgi:hypothetical protein